MAPPGLVPGWATLRAHRSTVRTVDISEQGTELLSGDDEGFVAVWSLESRRPIAIWQAHENALLTTKFWRRAENEESLIVTHARDNKMRVWRHPHSDGLENRVYHTSPIPREQDTNGKEISYPKPWLVYTQDVNALNFCSVALSSTGSLFATAASIASERIDVYSLDASYQLSRPYKALDASDAIPLDTQLEAEASAGRRRGLLGAVMNLKLADSILVAGYESGHVAVFDLATGRVKLLVQNHKEPILSLAISGRHGTSTGFVYVSAADRMISVINLETAEVTKGTLLEHRGVASVDLMDLEDLTVLVSAGWDGKVRVFEAMGSQVREIESFPGGRQQGVTAVKIQAVSPNATKKRLKPWPKAWIAVAGKDGRVGLFAFSGSATNDSLKLEQ